MSDDVVVYIHIDILYTIDKYHTNVNSNATGYWSYFCKREDVHSTK